MTRPWKPLLATLTIALALAPAASSGEPVGGTSSVICTEPVDGLPEIETGLPDCPRPDVAVICPRRTFGWGQECWGRREGAAFTRWLRVHGASPVEFRKRHPDLARIFGSHWPGVNWQALERSFPKAAAYAGGRFNVSASWLSSCAASEGGRTPGHIAIGAAGEVGWFQYLSGTWAFMSRSAFQTRGAPPNPYRHIRSIVGQTWTTAWAFSRGLSYHWHGSGC